MSTNDLRRRTYLLSLLNMGEVLYCGRLFDSGDTTYSSDLVISLNRELDFTKEFIVLTASITYVRYLTSDNTNLFLANSSDFDYRTSSLIIDREFEVSESNKAYYGHALINSGNVNSNLSCYVRVNLVNKSSVGIRKYSKTKDFAGHLIVMAIPRTDV